MKQDTFAVLWYFDNSLLSTEQLIRIDLPVSTTISLLLYKTLLDKAPVSQGHRMFSDYYTSCSLPKKLYKIKCYLTKQIRRKYSNK